MARVHGPILAILCAGTVTAQEADQAAGHWAFAPPQRPVPPATAAPDWGPHPIDAFVLERLRTEQLTPSPRADRATLARRLSLALTGLPPQPEQVDALVDDAASTRAAVESYVDRLLASERYGEHMARWWLDLARYADTDGYHIDGHRDMTVWRDWVIDAFNRDQPFDRFAVEQLAGDLLPQRTIPQWIATGFNRNHMTNIEGGADPEEYSVRYVVDRVNTTATVFLGLTVKCAECHDHKSDPISQEEYYRLYALFNNVPESGLDGYYGNAAPFIPVPDAAQTAQLGEIHRRMAEQQQALLAIEDELNEEQRAWQADVASRPIDSEVREGLLLHLPLEGDVSANVRGADEVRPLPGALGNAVRLPGNGTHLEYAEHIDAVDFERDRAFSIAAWVRPTSGGAVVSRMTDGMGGRGFELGATNRRLALVLAHRAPHDMLRVEATTPLRLDEWVHICGTYDGSGRASGLRLYVDGRPAATTVAADALTGTIRNRQPLRIGRRETELPYSGWIDDVRVYDGALAAEAVARLAMQRVAAALSVPAGERSERDATVLRDYFRRYVSPTSRAIAAHLTALKAEQDALMAEVSTCMVMAELPEPRPSHVLLRGDYRSPGKRVTPGVPAVLPPLPAGASADRLTFARWLVQDDHPLTARVLVNRLWQWMFGRGLVSTSGDFGVLGARPSHPQLLDWLATEMVRSGWSVKRMLRLVATSATFTQTGLVTDELLRRDPDNALLARSPRPRLGAEAIRDNALAIAGLLDARIGGASVRPFQPPGLWEEVAFGGNYPSQTYEQSAGADLYRRGLYVYWKRSAPYASFRVFDAPTRELCETERPVTNTPLQALTLLNDPVYTECARGLAARLWAADGDDRARLRHGLRLCVARQPRPGEIDALQALLDAERQRFAQHTAAATELLSTGALALPPQAPAPELAAWTTVGSALLNLSETITRP